MQRTAVVQGLRARSERVELFRQAQIEPRAGLALSAPSQTPPDDVALGEIALERSGRSGPARYASRTLSVAAGVAAVGVAAVLTLFRVALIPAWHSIYAEDYGIFLVQSLSHPWDLLVPYNGYLQLAPRLLAQLVSYLPLTRAAAGFAVGGSLVAGLCALFTYHASAGYIRSPALRMLLAAALILNPAGPLSVEANGVCTPWFLLAALFWAALWRPRTRAGAVTAAVVGFAAAASDPMALVVAPVLAVRLFTLRRVRDHAVTAGYLAGWVLQGYVIWLSYAEHTQRVGKLAPVGGAVSYYLHTVVLRAFGWHISWHLVAALGLSGATLACGLALALVAGWALTTGRQARNFTVIAVATGFVLTVGGAMINSYVVPQAQLLRPVSYEAASWYTLVPITLLDAIPIVALDALAQRHGGLLATFRALWRKTTRGARPFAVAGTAVALVAVLCVGWATDYQYPSQRTSGGYWEPHAMKYLDKCRDHSTVWMYEWHDNSTISVPIPCSRVVK